MSKHSTLVWRLPYVIVEEGVETSACATLEPPIEDAQGRWSCGVDIPPFTHRRMTLYGADPIHALAIAIAFMNDAIVATQARGVQLLYPGGGALAPFPLTLRSPTET
jgi:hypothetical protein